MKQVCNPGLKLTQSCFSGGKLMSVNAYSKNSGWAVHSINTHAAYGSTKNEST